MGRTLGFVLCSWLFPSALAVPQEAPSSGAAEPAASPAATEEDRAEFRRQLRAMKPRDTEGLVALARWCRERNLEEEATRCLEKVLRIDPDHREARQALGYTRWGTGWRLSSGASAAEPADTTGAPPPEEGSATTGDTETAPEEKTTAPEPVSEVKTVPKRWGMDDLKARARAVSEATGIKFRDLSADPLLVHTNRRDAAFQEIIRSLRALCLDGSKVVGLKTKDTWIGPRLQVFAFERPAEFMKFVNVYEKRDAGSSTYSFNAKMGYLAFSTINVPTFAGELGRELVARAGSPSEADPSLAVARWVIPWLADGFSEWLTCLGYSTPQRRNRNFQLVKDWMIRAGDAARIAEFLERPGPGGPGPSRPAVFTIVDLLIQRKKFPTFLRALLTEETPPEPQGTQKMAEADFLKFIEQQWQAFAKVYRVDAEKLNDMWKKHVLSAGAQ